MFKQKKQHNVLKPVFITSSKKILSNNYLTLQTIGGEYFPADRKPRIQLFVHMSLSLARAQSIRHFA
jgi:hypothetical protein